MGIIPATTRGSRLHLLLTDRSGEPLRATEVELKVSNPGRNVGGIPVPMTQRNGVWVARSASRSTGDWKAVLTVDDDNPTAIVTSGDFDDHRVGKPTPAVAGGPGLPSVAAAVRSERSTFKRCCASTSATGRSKPRAAPTLPHGMAAIDRYTGREEPQVIPEGAGPVKRIWLAFFFPRRRCCARRGRGRGRGSGGARARSGRRALTRSRSAHAWSCRGRGFDSPVRVTRSWWAWSHRSPGVPVVGASAVAARSSLGVAGARVARRAA